MAGDLSVGTSGMSGTVCGQTHWHSSSWKQIGVGIVRRLLSDSHQTLQPISPILAAQFAVLQVQEST